MDSYKKHPYWKNYQGFFPEHSQITDESIITLADPRLPITKQQFAKNTLMLKLGMPLLPFFTKIAGRLRLPIKWFTKMSAMSSNLRLTKIVLNDPLGGGNSVPVSFMHSLLNARPAIEPEDFDLCPILLAHPSDDKWTELTSSQHFFDRIKGPESFQLLENCGHFPVEEPGITQLESSAKAFIERVLKI